MSATEVRQASITEASGQGPTFMTLVYKGPGGEDYTFSTASFDAVRWYGNIEIAAEPGRLSPKSDYNPGTCLYNNVLYVAYKGWDSDELWFSSYDGTRWSGDQPIVIGGNLVQKSEHPPALCAFKGLMYMVHKAKSTNNIILSSFDGTTWSGGRQIWIGSEDPKTSDALWTAVYRGAMYISYKGDSTNKLYTASFDGTRWVGGEAISTDKGEPKSNYGPVIAEFGDRLYLAYKGESTNTLYTASFDGRGWTGNNPINKQAGGIDPKSNYTPGAIAVYGRLHLVYKGAGTNTLYTASFDGTTWYGNTPIYDQTGKIEPESNYNPRPCSVPWLLGGLPSWLSRVPDTTELWRLNLPGTHDSAAINTSTTTLMARHFLTLTRQLAAGVRALDIRLKVKEDASGSYYFMTCHGDAPVVDNEYQSFVSALDECSTFLQTYRTETIVMSLKIDDWNGYEKEYNAVFTTLSRVLNRYPIVVTPDAVTLGAVRGRIYLVNRVLIPDSADPADPCTGLDFGTPICDWPDNASQYCPPDGGSRDFGVWVQDNWKDLGSDPAAKKLEAFKAAIRDAGGGALINFASATSGPADGQVVYVQEPFLNWLGSTDAAGRPRNLGWALFDYESNYYQSTIGSWLVNCVQIVVASNFGYEGYEEPFRVRNPG